MHVSFSHNMLAITIEDDAKTFYHLQNIIIKNFQKCLGKKDKTIIFRDENETVQRRYFLKLIAKIYQKKHPHAASEIIVRIQQAYNMSIKIAHLKSNQLQQQLKIRVFIEDNYVVVFEISAHQSILINYLKNYFKSHLVRYRIKKGTFTLYPLGEQTAKLLDKLLNKKEIVGSYIDFIYDISAFITYKNTLREKINRKKRFLAIYSLLSEYYEILGCSDKDSFEEIRTRYLRLVKQYHPDFLSKQDRLLQMHYIEKFRTIQNAYDMIKIHFQNTRVA